MILMLFFGERESFDLEEKASLRERGIDRAVNSST